MISPLRFVVSLTKRSKLTVITIAIVVLFVTATLIIVYSFEMSNKALIERFESNYYIISSSDNLLKSKIKESIPDAAYVWIVQGKVNNISTYIIGVKDIHHVLNVELSCQPSSIIVGKKLNVSKWAHVEFEGKSLNLTVDRKMSFSMFPDTWVVVNHTVISSASPNFAIVYKKINVAGYGTRSMTTLSTFYEKTAEEISFDLFILDLISMVVIYLFINALLSIEIRENVKKIAIIRAIGSTGKNIGGLYFLRALYIGTIGTLIGFSAGVIISYLLAAVIPLFGMMTYFSIYIPHAVFYADVIIAVLGSSLASISPVRTALKIKPIEGIKGVRS